MILWALLCSQFSVPITALSSNSHWVFQKDVVRDSEENFDMHHIEKSSLSSWHRLRTDLIWNTKPAETFSLPWTRFCISSVDTLTDLHRLCPLMSSVGKVSCFLLLVLLNFKVNLGFPKNLQKRSLSLCSQYLQGTQELTLRWYHLGFLLGIQEKSCSWIFYNNNSLVHISEEKPNWENCIWSKLLNK